MNIYDLKKGVIGNIDNVDQKDVEEFLKNFKKKLIKGGENTGKMDRGYYKFV